MEVQREHRNRVMALTPEEKPQLSWDLKNGECRDAGPNKCIKFHRDVDVSVDVGRGTRPAQRLTPKGRPPQKAK